MKFSNVDRIIDLLDADEIGYKYLASEVKLVASKSRSVDDLNWEKYGISRGLKVAMVHCHAKWLKLYRNSKEVAN